MAQDAIVLLRQLLEVLRESPERTFELVLHRHSTVRLLTSVLAMFPGAYRPLEVDGLVVDCVTIALEHLLWAETLGHPARLFDVFLEKLGNIEDHVRVPLGRSSRPAIRMAHAIFHIARMPVPLENKRRVFYSSDVVLDHFRAKDVASPISVWALRDVACSNLSYRLIDKEMVSWLLRVVVNSRLDDYSRVCVVDTLCRLLFDYQRDPVRCRSFFEQVLSGRANLESLAVSSEPARELLEFVVGESERQTPSVSPGLLAA